MMFDGHGHEGVTGLGDAPAAGAWDSGDEAADVEAFEFAADASGEAALGSGIRRRAGIEHGAHVGVFEPVQVVLPLEERLEQGDVLISAGVEAAIRALLMLKAVGTQPQELLGRCRIVGDGFSDHRPRAVRRNLR